MIDRALSLTAAIVLVYAIAALLFLNSLAPALALVALSGVAWLLRRVVARRRREAVVETTFLGLLRRRPWPGDHHPWEGVQSSGPSLPFVLIDRAEPGEPSGESPVAPTLPVTLIGPVGSVADPKYGQWSPDTDAEWVDPKYQLWSPDERAAEGPLTAPWGRPEDDPHAR